MTLLELQDSLDLEANSFSCQSDSGNNNNNNNSRQSELSQ